LKEVGVSVPKIKTHKTAAKRFKISGTGKLMHVPGGGKGGKVHFRRRKSRATLSSFNNTEPITNKADEKRIKRLLPFLKEKKR
jgi:large subunit ribosomal protein L35